MINEFKNIYNYDLDELETFYINEYGEIVGGSNSKCNYKTGSVFSPLDNGLELKVLEVKKILIVQKL